MRSSSRLGSSHKFSLLSILSLKAIAMQKVFNVFSCIKILKGLHPLLDAEAIRLIRSMPRWNPALDIWTLKPKDERFTIAVVFKKRDKK